jgi:hypothetical protein
MKRKSNLELMLEIARNRPELSKILSEARNVRKKDTYSKWDDFEEAAVAFGKVKSGEWDKERFEEWFNHAYCVISRDATAGEDM